MDRISDSGSDDHGSNPCGGTDFRGRFPLRTPRFSALWYSLGLMPRECPASAGRVNATA